MLYIFDVSTKSNELTLNSSLNWFLIAKVDMTRIDPFQRINPADPSPLKLDKHIHSFSYLFYQYHHNL